MDTAKHVRSYITRRLRANQQKPPRVYDDINTAVATRQKTATTWPGNQTISAEASLQLVERGVTRLDGQRVQFRHDPRLSWPSIQYMTTEQVHGIYKDVQCPTALLLATNGWPFDSSLPRNKEGLELLQPRLQKTLPGSHHFHMDPDSAAAVAQEVMHFLEL